MAIIWGEWVYGNYRDGGWRPGYRVGVSFTQTNTSDTLTRFDYTIWLDVAERIWYSANPVYFNVNSNGLQIPAQDVFQSTKPTEPQALYSSYFELLRQTVDTTASIDAGFALRAGVGGSYSDLEGVFATVATTVTVPAMQYTLTLNKTEGVEYFRCADGSTSKTVDAGTEITTECKALPGYHLTKYVGPTHDGSSNSEWPCSGSEHNETWTMNTNRTITAYAEPDGVSLYDGSSWGNYRAAIYNGATWEYYKPAIRAGDAWKT